MLSSRKFTQIKRLEGDGFRFYRWLTMVLAASILILIITLNVVFWPISDLGFQVDPRTAIVLDVDSTRSAGQAGLQIGDRIVTLYGLLWGDVIRQQNMLQLIGSQDDLISISVQREDDIYIYLLDQGTPSISFQMNKAIRLFIAFLCWITGYILGVARRHNSPGTPLVSIFWLGLSCVLGSLLFAVHASYILSITLYWFTITILIPLSIYIHFWFPVRTIQKFEPVSTQKYLIGSWILFNVIILVFIRVTMPSLPGLLIDLGFMLSYALFVGFIGSAGILLRAYHKNIIVHTRRQIRLIGMACFLVAAFWLFTLILPRFIIDETLITDYWIDLIAGAIPLAYLISSSTTDLYRIDRIMMRISVHMASSLLLVGVIIAVIDMLSLVGTQTTLWGTVVFVVFYGRTKIMLMSIFSKSLLKNPYISLHYTARELTTKLETKPLVDILCEGIKSTFDQPALAFYIADPEGTNELTLIKNERLIDLPEVILPGNLTDYLSELLIITESRTLVEELAQSILNTDEEHTIRHPRIVLWCPIRHTEGHLLGLLLLGMRGDFDPYRGQDIRELQRLIHAAVLAFSNSAAYARHRNAEAIIRQLYHQLQSVQDETAAAIARELHDEIINCNVRLNIESLQKLLLNVQDSTIHDELTLVLEGERNVSQALRVICEQLHPTGIDDPLGLPSVLRLQVEKIQANWSGTCRLIIENKPCPLSPQAQHEALRIVREALINAVKHAQATEIIVRLEYPEKSNGQVSLSVQDNGTSGLTVKAKRGHFGIRNMEESARAVGGKLRFHQNEVKGTTIIFSFSSAFTLSDPSMYTFVEA